MSKFHFSLAKEPAAAAQPAAVPTSTPSEVEARERAEVLRMVREFAGKEMLDNALECTRDRSGTWNVAVAGEHLASINIASGSMLVSMLAGRDKDLCVGDVQTTRVVCSGCKQPKVLPGRTPPGICYTCHCGRTVFIR